MNQLYIVEIKMQYSEKVMEDGVVKVKLTGACGGCPMAQMTLKAGIEKVLKEEVPKIKKVEAV